MKKNTLVLIFSIFIFYTMPTLTVFYGGQKWQDKNSGKNIYLLYEAHQPRNLPQVEKIIKEAEETESKVLIESRYEQTKQNPIYARSDLPFLHKRCLEETIPVQDIDIRGVVPGTYKDGKTKINKKQLMTVLKKTMDEFTQLKENMKKIDAPKQIKVFCEKEIKELEDNQFFTLIAQAVEKKESADTFMQSYLDLAGKKDFWEILNTHKKLKRRKKLKKLPATIFLHMTNYELLRLVDLKAIEQIFESLAKYGSIILAAGGKHCAYVADLFGDVSSLELVKNSGDTDEIGGFKPIKIKKLF